MQSLAPMVPEKYSLLQVLSGSMQLSEGNGQWSTGNGQLANEEVYINRFRSVLPYLEVVEEMTVRKNSWNFIITLNHFYPLFRLTPLFRS